MSVQLEPSELGFPRPSMYEATQLLRLRNPGVDPIAFKVKTTAPKQYCVRPNAGRIEPGEEVEVQVILQARPDPPADQKCRDKFLVQSVAIPPASEKLNPTVIWQNVEKFSKGDIQERKIRVVYVPSEGTGSPPYEAYVNGTHDDAPPAYGSPSPSYSSPGQDAGTPSNRTAATNSGSASHIQPRLQDNNDRGGGQDSAPTVASSIQSTMVGAASTVANTIPISSEDLRAQLSEAKATIAKLRQQGVLGQRKSNEGNQDFKEQSPPGMKAIQQSTSEGVPVSIVAGLCLLSFLLAYFFF